MEGALALGLGLAAGSVLTPVARRVALAFNVVDSPGSLKPQHEPVAYLGGVAVFLGACVGPLLSGRPMVLVPMAMALLLGLGDDIRQLGVMPRLAIEVAIAVTAAILVPGPPLAQLATAVLVLALLNAMNLLDGQDGLAAGVGVVICIAYAALGGAATPVALGMAGALIAFLRLNWSPARIYLGDAGSYLCGTTLAMMPALTQHSSTSWSIWWSVPLFFAVPATDTAIAIIRRVRLGRSILRGDRSHVYDQLVDRGMSVKNSARIGICLQVVFTGFGLIATQTPPTVALAITVVCAIAIAIASWRAGFVGNS